MVLDESPACVKQLVDTAKTNRGDARAIEPLPVDESSYLEYITDVLGVLAREEVSVGEERRRQGDNPHVGEKFCKKDDSGTTSSHVETPSSGTSANNADETSATSGQVAEDVRKFGISMARSFMEERVEPSKAQNES